MEAEARRFGRMVCDVGFEPANELSLAFHTARGYLHMGRLHEGREKVVALMYRDLTPAITR
jgi:predicted GNAT superfamily acetyltransferase